MASACEVVTYELEHLDASVAEAVAARGLLRPGVRALRVTQDRLAERHFLGDLGITVAAWREAATIEGARAAAGLLGYPLRLKRPRGGYDGRSQTRVDGPAELEAAWIELDAGGSMLVERELDYEMELSVVCTRGVDGLITIFPVARNTHNAGILVETVAPAPVPSRLADEAGALASRIAEKLDVVGTLTAELFLLRDGSLIVNELAPRVHNSGHFTDDACLTSQFEQHIRAICGLPLGDTGMRSGYAAMVNLLGTGPRRPAHPTGLEGMLEDPAARVHLYDKREVFERRKMGHVTVVSDSSDDALRRARCAAARSGWAP
jgi:5-(carboxyamino)imidazole ribonucleotide synthase